MKKYENSSSTEGSVCERRESSKIPNEKLLALLKFVYYERKSIKQASNYLGINYNSAKRIIKNFRKKKIPLSLLQKRERSNSESSANMNSSMTSEEMQSPITQNTFSPQDYLVSEIKKMTNQIQFLNQEINNNHNTLNFLASYTQSLMVKYSPHRAMYYTN